MSEQLALEAITRAIQEVAGADSRAAQMRLSVFCIIRLADLDRLAAVFGMDAVGFATQEFNLRLRGAVRASDEMIQLSARTWALMLKGIAGKDLMVLALGRLERLLEEPVLINGDPVELRANLGFNVVDGSKSSAESIFWMTEQSLEDAKATGRIAIWRGEHESAAAGQNWLRERELRQALEDGEFRLYFQPKVAAGSRAVVGAEALVRWHSRKHGVLAPGAFIEVIERSELVVPFTHFIFKHALSLAGAWPGRLKVAVNLPPTVLSDESLSHTICDALSIFDIEPQRLEIEVTEGSLMRDVAVASAHLGALRDIGIGISIDDFGTGHSSLAQLRSLPVDEIKIDRSFVAEVIQQPDLVKYIIDLARALNLTVVAEGVEEEAQATLLAEQGADFLQGYWIARPMEQATFIAWLGSQGVT